MISRTTVHFNHKVGNIRTIEKHQQNKYEYVKHLAECNNKEICNKTRISALQLDYISKFPKLFIHPYTALDPSRESATVLLLGR